MYDYIVVGAGLFGAIFAHEANKRGKKVVVIEKREHIGGNCYTEEINKINVHKYGAHIFHTSNKEVWEYINKFAEFNNFINSPIANYKGEIYNLPFNMNTFNKLWGVVTPNEAIKKIEEQKLELFGKEPENLEEQAISLVGRDIYEKLIKGYTEKQWGRDCKELPAFIIKRIPVRLRYDNNYFNDKYQGIPIGGYTKIFEKLLDGIEVRTNTDFFANKEKYVSSAKKIVYTGMIDKFFDYKFGTLEYRSLKFENESLEIKDFQGNAVVNYTEKNVPYTRIIEHKHFEYGEQENSIITKEYPANWNIGDEPYYPVNDENNSILYNKYKILANEEKNIIFGGRLADYRYYDMHNVIERVLEILKKEL